MMIIVAFIWFDCLYSVGLSQPMMSASKHACTNTNCALLFVKTRACLNVLDEISTLVSCSRFIYDEHQDQPTFGS